jgi:toxin ParE1/3/4
MKVRYTETAIEEIEDILFRIQSDNPVAAAEVAAVIKATTARLADFPRMAFETDIPGVRVSPVLPYRYLVFYAIDQAQPWRELLRSSR